MIIKAQFCLLFLLISILITRISQFFYHHTSYR